MTRFQYKAIDPRGRRVAGRIEAVNRSLATENLEALALTPTAVTPMVIGEADVGSAKRGSIGAPDLLAFTRAISAFLSAGIPTGRALHAASGWVRGGTSGRQALAEVARRVEQGGSVADALAANEVGFPPAYVGVVRAGERGGDLAAAFARLELQLEKEEQLRSRLASLAIYPSLLAAVGAGAVALLLLLVLPRFAGLLANAGAQLPASTAFMLEVSNLARSSWPLLFALPIAASIGIVAVRHSPSGTQRVASVLLTLPVIGEFRRDLLAARFGQLMHVLLGGGAPVLTALEDTAESLSDPVARSETLRIREEVRQGTSISRALQSSRLYPPAFAELIALGEQAGRLKEFFGKAADVFEKRTERAASRLMALAEPAMIIVFGFIVGAVALSLLQAIYGVNAASFR